jgi:hypothetical protein
MVFAKRSARKYYRSLPNEVKPVSGYSRHRSLKRAVCQLQDSRCHNATFSASSQSIVPTLDHALKKKSPHSMNEQRGFFADVNF